MASTEDPVHLPGGLGDRLMFRTLDDVPRVRIVSVSRLLSLADRSNQVSNR